MARQGMTRQDNTLQEGGGTRLTVGDKVLGTKYTKVIKDNCLML